MHCMHSTGQTMMEYLSHFKHLPLRQAGMLLGLRLLSWDTCCWAIDLTFLLFLFFLFSLDNLYMLQVVTQVQEQKFKLVNLLVKWCESIVYPNKQLQEALTTSLLMHGWCKWCLKIYIEINFVLPFLSVTYDFVLALHWKLHFLYAVNLFLKEIKMPHKWLGRKVLFSELLLMPKREWSKDAHKMYSLHTHLHHQREKEKGKKTWT